MSEADISTRPRANSLASVPTLSLSQRRLRSNTQLSAVASTDSLTPRNRARALAHLRLVGDQQQNYSDSDESNDSNSEESGSSSSTSTTTEFVKPPHNLNQADVNAARDETRRIDAIEAARPKRVVRRVKSECYEEREPQPDELTQAARAIGAALKLPTTMLMGDDDDDDDEDDHTTVTDTSPRTGDTQRAAHNQRHLMQQYLNGDTCDYSWSEFHKCVWLGLTDTLREQFWAVQCVTPETTLLPIFDTLIEDARLSHRTFNDIMTDIYRTDGEEANRNPLFINTLYRGLIAHAALRRDIGYMQGMNFLWGVIVTSVSKPQKQLHVAEYIVRNVLPHYFTTDQIVGACIDAVVLRHYLTRRCPKLEAMLRTKFGIDNVHPILLRTTTSWFTPLYTVILQKHQAKRLWDLIMLRGAVELFEFTLRLFIYGYKCKWLERSSCWPEFLMEIQSKLAQMTSIDPILETHLPSGRLVAEDFASRRRMATRIVFADLNASVNIIDAGQK